MNIYSSFIHTCKKLETLEISFSELKVKQTNTSIAWNTTQQEKGMNY